MAFKYELNSYVEITLSGQEGRVNGRCEYAEHKHVNSYQVHHINGDGDAVYSWFDEDDLEEVTY